MASFITAIPKQKRINTIAKKWRRKMLRPDCLLRKNYDGTLAAATGTRQSAASTWVCVGFQRPAAAPSIHDWYHHQHNPETNNILISDTITKQSSAIDTAGLDTSWVISQTIFQANSIDWCKKRMQETGHLLSQFELNPSRKMWFHYCSVTFILIYF